MAMPSLIFSEKETNIVCCNLLGALTFTTLYANSADDKLMIFFLISPGNRIWHFIQIVSIGDNLHEMSNPVFLDKNKKKIFQNVVW